MGHDTYHTDALILGARSRGEADMMISAYTKDFGGVTALAKSVRLEKSKLRGALDMFSLAHIGFVAGRDIYRLTHTESIEVLARVREDLFRFRAMSAVARILSTVVADGEHDMPLWELLVDTAHAIDSKELTEENTRTLLYAFQVRLLAQLGYLPESLPEVAATLYRGVSIIPRATLSAAECDHMHHFLSGIYRYAGQMRRAQ